MKEIADLIAIKSTFFDFNKQLNVFETFSGIGSQNRALKILSDCFGFKFNVVATSEWDVYAMIAYCRIHYPNYNIDENHKSEEFIDSFFKNKNLSLDGKQKISFNNFKKLDYKFKNRIYNSFILTKNQGDITSIDGKFLKSAIGKIDLITYSFPCQDLSVAGSLHGFNKGMKKNSKTRSSLLWEIERILKGLKQIKSLPKFLLLENVPNILSPKHNKDFVEWKKSLHKLGYKSKTIVFNSKDFSFPQNRKRVFSIAILKCKLKIDDNYEIIDFFQKVFFIKNKNESIYKKFFENDFFDMSYFNKKINFPSSLKKIIREDYSNKEYLAEAKDCLIKNTASRIKMINKSRILNEYSTSNYSRTLTTKQDRFPNAGVISLEKQQNIFLRENYTSFRFLTPREAYLLTGFYEYDFENLKNFVLKKDKMYQQTGNSIVVKVLIPIFFIIFYIFYLEKI